MEEWEDSGTKLVLKIALLQSQSMRNKERMQKIDEMHGQIKNLRLKIQERREQQPVREIQIENESIRRLWSRIVGSGGLEKIEEELWEKLMSIQQTLSNSPFSDDIQGRLSDFDKELRPIYSLLSELEELCKLPPEEERMKAFSSRIALAKKRVWEGIQILAQTRLALIQDRITVLEQIVLARWASLHEENLKPLQEEMEKLIQEANTVGSNPAIAEPVAEMINKTKLRAKKLIKQAPNARQLKELLKRTESISIGLSYICVGSTAQLYGLYGDSHLSVERMNVLGRRIICAQEKIGEVELQLEELRRRANELKGRDGVYEEIRQETDRLGINDIKQQIEEYSRKTRRIQAQLSLKMVKQSVERLQQDKTPLAPEKVATVLEELQGQMAKLKDGYDDLPSASDPRWAANPLTREEARRLEQRLDSLRRERFSQVCKS
jgi:hypothetical protein